MKYLQTIFYCLNFFKQTNMKLSLFLILTGMVTILFAGVTLKKNNEQMFWSVKGDQNGKVGYLTDTVPLLELDGERGSIFSVTDGFERYFSIRRTYLNGDTTESIDVVDSSNIVATYENGKWEIIDCVKAMEVFVFCVRQMQEDNERQREEVTPSAPISFASYIDTISKQSYIEFNSTGTSIFSGGKEVALRRKNGTWKVIDSRKALEVMYQNIYKRDSVRK